MFFTSLFQIHYVDVDDECLIIQLSFYFTTINVTRTVLPFQLTKNTVEICRLI